MINKVNADVAVRYQETVKTADEKPRNEQNAPAVSDSDKIEISSRAKVAAQKAKADTFMEVFSKTFWAHGLNEAYTQAMDTLRKTYPQSEIDPSVVTSDETVEELLAGYENQGISERVSETDDSSDTESQRKMTAMKISQRIAKGDNVPMQDHRFLAEYDPNLYKASLKASMVADNKDPENHESLADALVATEQAKSNPGTQEEELGTEAAKTGIDITVDGDMVQNED